MHHTDAHTDTHTDRQIDTTKISTYIYPVYVDAKIVIQTVLAYVLPNSYTLR